MPRNTAYFDSQASAAASLGIDLYEIRDANSAGCPAFRSGRVYRDELLKWFEKNRARLTGRNDSDDEIFGAYNWKNRRNVLFNVLEFLHDAYEQKLIDLLTYSTAGSATVELLIRLGDAWDAGIDAAGFRKTWGACLARALFKKTKRTSALPVDKHTARGKQLGRSWDHWASEGCQLQNEAKGMDTYATEALSLRKKHGKLKQNAPASEATSRLPAAKVPLWS